MSHFSSPTIPCEYLDFESLELPVEPIEAERFRNVGPAVPIEEILAIGMLRVSHGFDEVFVTWHAAAVIRRVGAGTGKAGDGSVGDLWKSFSTRTSCCQLTPKSYS